MVFRAEKRAVCLGIMLVLTAFVGITANVSATGLPPVAEAGGPYTGNECYEMSLDASGSYDPEGASLSYHWYICGLYIDNNGDPILKWTWLDDFSGEVTLEVSDGDLIATDTTEVTVLNVPPVITSTTGPTEVSLGSAAPISVNFYDGFPDPRGLVASLDTYNATFSWGDDSSTVLSLGIAEFWANASHVYMKMGEYHIFITIVDDNGGEASTEWDIMVISAPEIEAGSDAFIDEGSMFASAGYFVKVMEGTYTATVDYGDGSGSQPLPLNPDYTFALSHQYLDNGMYSVVVTIFNYGAVYGSDSALVTVTNVPPTITSLSGPPTDPIQLGSSITLNGVFTDPGILDSHVALITWDDGQTTTVNLLADVYQVSESHPYANAGVYTITLTVTDKDGGSDSMSIESYVVVYDQNAGFVTGGGWIIAQAGSYPADPTLSGRCNFGFVSKYLKGHSTPSGNTEFQFQVASLNFHSDSYEWLVIAGAKAMYKGVGTINGNGHYGFILTSIDGQINGGGGVDKFRIKIWDKDNNDQIVFDNNNGASDDQNPTTALSGGQITIHKV